MTNEIQEGKHLIMNLFRCEKLPLEEDAHKLFTKITDSNNMKILIQPCIIARADGISGFVITETNHISIHTNYSTRFIALDLYSCVTFDENKVKDRIINLFKPKLEETKIIRR